MTYMEADAPAAADFEALALEYFGDLGGPTCGEAGWVAAFVTSSEGMVRATIRCGTELDADALIGLEGDSSGGAALPGASRRKARISIAGGAEEGLDAAGKQALERALELAGNCAVDEAVSWSETTADDAGRTTEIRVECDRP